MPKRSASASPCVDAESLGERRASTPARLAIVPGARLSGKVERHETFGIFVFLAPGIVGLLPRSETGVANDADLKKMFPVGASVDVVVLEADASGRRIRLSVTAVQKADGSRRRARLRDP